ncbi:MAG TPA: hypothetical protein VFK26_08830 [Gemmatimonadaceae bacterium]|nr:hypothetical protein [Gemmatimonadaceae bacterium]
MDEDSFEEVLRDLPRSFNQPPEPPLDEMWTEIEDAHFNARVPITRARPFAARATWLAAAAALVVGIGIGRYLPDKSATGAATPSLASGATAPVSETSAVADAYRDQTNHYLGQAAALLISLPAKDASPKTDSAFSAKASDLLVTTRLLIDSPAAAQDVKLRSLLEDLELVLVQIARLQVDRHNGDLDLIHQAVEQGDVLSRLNSAVATTQSSE